ncbi:MAG: dihydrolipoyl dehydrogenase [Candidatus Micrarchaeia archaeon]
MEYDAVVIGSGPAGFSCAMTVARLGGKVAVVEKGKIGGVCANAGCIPTKSLCHHAELHRLMKSAASGESTQQVDFKKIMHEARSAAKKASDGVAFMLKKNGVGVFYGEARIRDSQTVSVGEKCIKARNIVIATGSRPIPLGDNAFDGRILSGESMLSLENVPKSLLIVGGGAIGVEFASIMSAFNCKVAIVEMMGQLLPGFDRDVSSLVERSLKSSNVEIFTNSKVEGISDGFAVVGENKVQAEFILVAIGRRPVFDEEALERIGVKFDGRGIKVDGRMRTNVGGVYAVGDVVGGAMLAHKALEEGRVAGMNILGYEEEVDYSAIPHCVYSHPEVAAVGRLEGDSIGVSHFSSNGRGIAEGETTGFVKVFAKDGLLVGACIVGKNATELIAEPCLAIRNKLPLSAVARTVHAHPTFSESFRDAVFDCIKGKIGK